MIIAGVAPVQELEQDFKSSECLPESPAFSMQHPIMNVQSSLHQTHPAPGALGHGVESSGSSSLVAKALPLICSLQWL